jgi:predicted DNA-binding transcriptional regulator AlpA
MSLDDDLSPPPPASAPLSDWISWTVGELRFEPGANVALRRADVEAVSGLGRTAIDTMIAEGNFPAPFKMSDTGRAIAWDWIEVIAWRLWRLARRDEAKSAESRDLLEALRSLRRRA